MKRIILATVISMVLGSSAFALDVTTPPAITPTTKISSVTGYTHSIAQSYGDVTQINTGNIMNLSGTLSGSDTAAGGISNGTASTVGGGAKQSLAESAILGSVSLQIDPSFVSGQVANDQYSVISADHGTSITHGNVGVDGKILDNTISGTAGNSATSTTINPTTGLISSSGSSRSEFFGTITITPQQE